MTELFTEQKLKQEFPLTERFLYFNSASIGIIPERSIKRMEDFLQRYRNTDLAHDAETFIMIDRLRANLERLIGGESGTVCLVPNTSVGINIISSGFPWKTGDRILLGNLEFPANTYPWSSCKRLGVEIDWLDMDSGEITPEMVEMAINEQTRLLAISSVQFSDGYRTDLEAISKVCRKHDVFLFVDGIQSAGALKIDVIRSGIDAFASGGQKHMLSPYGTGFLYVSPRAMRLIVQAYDGWLAHFLIEEDFLDMLRHNMPIGKTARKYEVGSLPYQSLWSMDASVSMMLDFGKEAIETHNVGLAAHFCNRVEEIRGIKLFSKRATRASSHIVSVSSPFAPELYIRLKARGIICSLREERLRWAFHIYNTIFQIDRAVDIIKEEIEAIEKGE
ncbi:aminotransferase class V-fold PLP-dependent enzyme [bacterium]|nr:aminotransferase class V-fold PLP-dependent enzyme [bacterium]